jgi:hypothetical protein
VAGRGAAGGGYRHLGCHRRLRGGDQLRELDRALAVLIPTAARRTTVAVGAASECAASECAASECAASECAASECAASEFGLARKTQPTAREERPSGQRTLAERLEAASEQPAAVGAALAAARIICLDLMERPTATQSK